MSKQKINSTSGLFLTIILRVSKVNLPMPSSLFAIKNLVFTATRKMELFWLFANIVNRVVFNHKERQVFSER